MENHLKQILRLAIDENVPVVIQTKADIELLTNEKQALQSQIDKLNVELGIQEEMLAKNESVLLGLMQANGIQKMTTAKYAVERCRNANPTIEVVDMSLIPKRYIIETPKVDKRTIQSEYVSSRMIPPGVSVGYGQYLTIIERRKE